MLSPIDIIRRRAKRLVVAPPDEHGTALVYAITHHHAPELAALAVVETKRITEEAKRAENLQRRLERCKTDEERAAIEAEAKDVAEAMREAISEEMFGTAERRNAYLERVRTIVCQAVEAVGIALPDATVGPQPLGTDPREVCEDLGNGERLTPLRLVHTRFVTQAERDAARARNELSVFDHSDQELMTLSALFTAAFSVRGSVDPLPGRTRAAEVGGSAGEAVRMPGERADPGPRSAGGGNRRSRRSAGKSG